MKLANGANNLLEIAIGHAGSVQSTRDTKLKNCGRLHKRLTRPKKRNQLNRLLSEEES